MKEAEVTVITPVYNAEEFLEETIDSVLNQTFEDFEYYLINDQSTDSSLEILEAYQRRDSRVKVVTLEENSGAAVARNRGLELSQAPYIAFIDADDRWHPEKLDRQLAFMEESDHGFTYTNFERIDEEGKVLGGPDLPEALDYHGLLKNTAIACSTVMIDKRRVGDFRMPLVRKGQDTATWLQILRTYPKAYLLDEVLNQYRQVQGSLSSNRLGALKRTWNTYYNLEGLPLPQALYYFGHYVVNAILRRL